MNQLTAGDLVLGLGDLLGPRHDALVASATGRTYERKLARLHGDLEALPPALGGRAAAEELAATDLTHDGFAAALFLMCEAYQRLPAATADQKAAAARIRDAFVPSMAETTRPYADEAAAAGRRRATIAERAADLALFPVIGGDLSSWATGYVEAGARLDTLLSGRATAEAEADRSPAPGLRAKTIGVLTRMRGTLRDELEEDPALPRDLEARVFGYIDELAARRARPGGGTGPTPPGGPPTP